jgi:hypothetical protein
MRPSSQHFGGTELYAMQPQLAKTTAQEEAEMKEKGRK